MKAQFTSFGSVNLNPVINSPTDLISIKDLVDLGNQNRALSKEGGLDYEKITNSRKFGITNNPTTWRSFEEEINK